jgi:hypothetical protein
LTVPSYHVFEPRPGELARQAIERSRGAISPNGGEAPWRVVDFDGRVEFEGTRNQCIDFVEHAWWQAETAPSNDDYVHASSEAARLHLEARAGNDHRWQREPYLTATLVGLHTW